MSGHGGGVKAKAEDVFFSVGGPTQNQPRGDRTKMCVGVGVGVRLRQKGEKLEGAGSSRQQRRAGIVAVTRGDRIKVGSWQSKRAADPISDPD